MIVSYYCESCKSTTSIKHVLPVSFNIDCNCGGKANRVWRNIESTKENENISSAIETMKYSTLPSGKNKVAI